MKNILAVASFAVLACSALADSAPLMAGFREGGTTFGLWDSPAAKGCSSQEVVKRLHEAQDMLDE